MDEQSDESTDKEVMGERIGESEMEELVPEWGLRKIYGTTEIIRDVDVVTTVSEA